MPISTATLGYNAECFYSEWRILLIDMLKVGMQNVIILSVVMLSVAVPILQRPSVTKKVRRRRRRWHLVVETPDRPSFSLFFEAKNLKKRLYGAKLCPFKTTPGACTIKKNSGRNLWISVIS
jgi:hypothetical protein